MWLAERLKILHIDSTHEELPIACLLPTRIDVVDIFSFSRAMRAVFSDEFTDRIAELFVAPDSIRPAPSSTRIKFVIRMSLLRFDTRRILMLSAEETTAGDVRAVSELTELHALTASEG